MKPLTEILEELHDLSEELRPHIEAAAEAEDQELLGELRADLGAYRAQNRELQAGVDRREASLRQQAKHVDALEAELEASRKAHNAATTKIADLQEELEEALGILEREEKGARRDH